MRYVEAYTEFLVYCSKKLNKTVENLILEFEQTGLEDKFREMYNVNNNLSYQKYYNILGVDKYGIKGYTKAKKNN